jgi:ribosome-binding protein aMBF1 (putative translation factor)
MSLTAAEIRRTYGRRIADARQAAELTQLELAARLCDAGVPTTPQAVSRWEVGAVSPRDGARHALMAILGGDLFDATETAA